MFVKSTEKLKASITEQKDIREIEKTQGFKYKLLEKSNPIRQP